MLYKFVTKTAEFHLNDENETVINDFAYGIIWSNHQGTRDKVISPFNWQLEDAEFNRGHYLKDPRGEVRKVQWGVYHKAIEFVNWNAYDTYVLHKEHVDLLKRIEELHQDLQNAHSVHDALNVKHINLVLELENIQTQLLKIRQINEEGGPGSRTRVGRLLEKIIHPAEED